MGLYGCCEGSTTARDADAGKRERYSTRDGWTSANASDTFCGTVLVSLGVEAAVVLSLGDESRFGESAEVVDDEVEWCFGRLRESSFDDMTRVCPPNIPNLDAAISASGPMLSWMSRAGVACLLRYD